MRIQDKQSRKIPMGFRAFGMVGVFQSVKMRKPVPWESTIERDFYLWLEFDTAVKEYQPQPLTLSFFHETQRHIYTPDVRVDYCDVDQCPTCYEVKPNAIWKDRQFVERQRSVEEAFGDMEMHYQAVTPDHIYRQPLFATLKKLYPYAGNAVPNTVLEICAECIEKQGALPLSILRYHVERASYLVSDLYALLFQQRLHFDIQTPFNPHTVISLHGDYYGLDYLQTK